MGKRHRRIRARSATGQVAGAATEKPGLNSPIVQNGLPNPRSPTKAPRPSRSNLSPPPDTTGALKEQFHAPSSASAGGDRCSSMEAVLRDRPVNTGSLSDWTRRSTRFGTPTVGETRRVPWRADRVANGVLNPAELTRRRSGMPDQSLAFRSPTKAAMRQLLIRGPQVRILPGALHIANPALDRLAVHPACTERPHPRIALQALTWLVEVASWSHRRRRQVPRLSGCRDLPRGRTLRCARQS